MSWKWKLSIFADVWLCFVATFEPQCWEAACRSLAADKTPHTKLHRSSPWFPSGLPWFPVVALLPYKVFFGSLLRYFFPSKRQDKTQPWHHHDTIMRPWTIYLSPELRQKLSPTSPSISIQHIEDGRNIRAADVLHAQMKSCCLGLICKTGRGMVPVHRNVLENGGWAPKEINSKR